MPVIASGCPGEGSLRSLATAARDLKEGRRAGHPELLLFPSWGELQEYAGHDLAGRDLKPFVDLIDQHGPDAILAAPKSTVLNACSGDDEQQHWKMEDAYGPADDHYQLVGRARAEPDRPQAIK